MSYDLHLYGSKLKILFASIECRKSNEEEFSSYMTFSIYLQNYEIHNKKITKKWGTKKFTPRKNLHMVKNIIFFNSLHTFIYTCTEHNF